MSDNRKVVVITGASRGLGKETAIYLAKLGHRVYATMRNTKGVNASVVDEYQSLRDSQGLSLDVVDMDVTDKVSVESAIKAILECTHIDVLVNNVGVMNVGITEAYSVEELKKLFDTNVFSMARVTQAVIPHMRKRGKGLLIQISSVAGRVVFPFFGSYCASKFAFEALAETYKYELAIFGIDSVIVEPGPHRTDLIDNSPAPEGNSDVLVDYADHIELSKTIQRTFKEFQDTHDISDPQGVAQAIAGLVESEEKKPLRIVVGADFGVKNINETLAPLQKQFMKGLHLEDML